MTWRIMIVEDEAIVAHNLEGRLRELGYDVPALALSGEEAIQKVAECLPDLILMDIQLGGAMDGITTAERIRSSLDVPIIFVTGHSDDRTLERARITEPFGYVLKPFEMREVHIAIEMALFKHSVEKKLRESEEKLRSLVTSMEDVVFSLSPEGTLTDYFLPPNDTSHGFGEMCVGKSFRDVLPSASVDLFSFALDALKTKDAPQQFDYAVESADGTLWYNAVVSTRHDAKGAFAGATAVCRNITEKKNMEQELQEYAQNLEEKVAEKTRVLQILYDLEHSLQDLGLEEGLRLMETNACKLGFDEFVLGLFEEEGSAPKNLSGDEISLDPSLLSRLMDTGKQVTVSDEKRFQVWCPLLSIGKIVGVCGFLASRPVCIDEGTEHLTLFANEAAKFVERRKIRITPTIENKREGKRKYSLKKGFSYLLEEEASKKSYDIFTDYVLHGIMGLCLSRKNPRFLREEFILEKTPIVWLSSTIAEGEKSCTDPTEISILIKDFVRKSEEGIIILDGLEYLSTLWSFEVVLQFLHKLIEYISTTDIILVIPASPLVFEVRQLKLFEKEMTLLTL